MDFLIHYAIYIRTNHKYNRYNLSIKKKQKNNCIKEL